MKKVIVSFTSWKKRIQYAGQTVYNMLQQTLKPNEIVLNLAEEEFPNKENDLPDDLVLFEKTVNEFRINWVKENTKAFKKVIPIIKENKNTDCWILSVDDDIRYKNDYIEFMVKNAEENPNYYLSPATWGNHPIGYCMIYNPLWFKDDKLWSISVDNMNRIIASDHWIWENLKRNDIKLKVIKDIEKHLMDLHRENPLHNVYKNINFNERQKLIDKLLK